MIEKRASKKVFSASGLAAFLAIWGMAHAASVSVPEIVVYDQGSVLMSLVPGQKPQTLGRPLLGKRHHLGFDACVSPNGRTVAFVDFGDPAAREIYTVALDGSSRRQASHSAAFATNSSPAWSPNSQLIAFSHMDDETDPANKGELRVMNANGSGERVVFQASTAGTSVITPTWSPNGRRIAFFIAGENQAPALWVAEADGSGAKLRASKFPKNGEGGLDWSPNGKKFVFHSPRDGNLEIYSMNANGADQKRLTNDDAIDMDPAWSPDGEKIIFASKRSGNSNIYTMNADGSDITPLTDSREGDNTPSWARLR